MFESSIDKEEVKLLPLAKFEGDIRVISTQEEALEVVRELQNEAYLGFDTETKPTFNKGEYNHTALIQFSTLTKAYLFRINEMGLIAPLKMLMEDPSVLKIGISIRDDLKELRAFSPFNPTGFLDLNDIAKSLGITQIGMRSLAGIFLGERISKNKQTSNWESQELSPAQQIYAATDAWICLKMYKLLQNKNVI
ncbi:MAG: ribonuclease D [Marinoscillum sp.]|jgi:ribonuclease D